MLLSPLPAAALAGIELDRDSSLSSGTSTTSNCFFFGGTNRRGLPAALLAAAVDFGVSGRGLPEVPQERKAHGIELQAPNQSTARARAKRESPPHKSTPLQTQVTVALKDNVHRGPSHDGQALAGVGGSPSGEPRGIVFRSRSIFFIAVMWENEPRRGGVPCDPLLGTADDRAATPGRLKLRLPCPDNRPRRRHGGG